MPALYAPLGYPDSHVRRDCIQKHFENEGAQIQNADKQMLTSGRVLEHNKKSDFVYAWSAK